MPDWSIPSRSATDWYTELSVISVLPSWSSTVSLLACPHHCRTASGSVKALKTSSRGTSKVRVMTISWVPGSATTFRSLMEHSSPVERGCRSVGPLWSGGLLVVRPLLPLRPAQVVVQALVAPLALLPEPPVSLHPVGHLLERVCLQPAGPPLRLPPPGDQPRPLQHLEVLGHRGKAHLERLGQLRHRRRPRHQPGQDRPPGRVGQCREGAVESFRSHLA